MNALLQIGAFIALATKTEKELSILSKNITAETAAIELFEHMNIVATLTDNIMFILKALESSVINCDEKSQLIAHYNKKFYHYKNTYDDLFKRLEKMMKTDP